MDVARRARGGMSMRHAELSNDDRMHLCTLVPLWHRAFRDASVSLPNVFDAVHSGLLGDATTQGLARVLHAIGHDPADRATVVVPAIVSFLDRVSGVACGGHSFQRAGGNLQMAPRWMLQALPRLL